VSGGKVVGMLRFRLAVLKADNQFALTFETAIVFPQIKETLAELFHICIQRLHLLLLRH
jgi:hypothetical protein